MEGGTFAAVAAIAYNFGVYINQKREERIARNAQLEAEKAAMQLHIDDLTAQLEERGGDL